jgi:hypothetical protein
LDPRGMLGATMDYNHAMCIGVTHL